MQIPRLLKYLDIFSYFLILLTIILTPLFFSSALTNAFVLPKQYIFIGLILLSTFLFASRVVVSRQFYYRQSALDVPILILLLVALLSSLFSKNLYNSFLGRNEYFLINFVFLAFLALFYFVITNTVVNKNRWSMVVDSILAVGGAGAILFLIKHVFNYSLPYFGTVWNTFDGSNIGFGVWLAVIAVLAAGYLLKKNIGLVQSLFYGAVLILSLVCILVIGFKAVLWVVLAGLLLLLLFGISFLGKVRIWSLSLVFALLIINVVFLVYNSPKFLQVQLPAEISLGAAPSWSIARQSVFDNVKTFLLGSGLGSFATDFSKFRTTNFNYDTVAWSLRFNQPFNTYFALLSEGGIVLSVLFIFILFLVLGYVLNSWSSRKNLFVRTLSYDLDSGQEISSIDDFDIDIFLVLSAWLVLWVGMIFVFFGPMLWIMWWLMLGLIISGLYVSGYKSVKIRNWTLEDTPQYNLAFSFSLIVTMSIVIMFIVFGFRFLQAELAYKEAMASSDQAVISARLQRAISYRGNYDVYHMAQARYYLNLAIVEARKSDANIQTMTQLVAAAVSEARVASQLSPNQISTWENLAVMYENAAPIVAQAGDWAIKSLETATNLEPSNAYLYARLGANYLQNKNESKAIASYQKAIELKNDYVSAFMALASIYEQKQDLASALKIYDQGLQASTQSVDFLYNYGRILYNNNQNDDRQKAEALWKLVLRYQPDFSNALYSLGLLYEGKGNKSEALKYYSQVQTLNPDNTDIVKKINSLSTVVAPKAGTSTKP